MRRGIDCRDDMEGSRHAGRAYAGERIDDRQDRSTLLAAARV
jgi:hypothetical protein